MNKVETAKFVGGLDWYLKCFSDQPEALNFEVKGNKLRTLTRQSFSQLENYATAALPDGWYTRSMLTMLVEWLNFYPRGTLSLEPSTNGFACKTDRGTVRLPKIEAPASEFENLDEIVLKPLLANTLTANCSTIEFVSMNRAVTVFEDYMNRVELISYELIDQPEITTPKFRVSTTQGLLPKGGGFMLLNDCTIPDGWSATYAREGLDFACVILLASKGECVNLHVAEHTKNQLSPLMITNDVGVTVVLPAIWNVSM